VDPNNNMTMGIAIKGASLEEEQTPLRTRIPRTLNGHRRVDLLCVCAILRALGIFRGYLPIHKVKFELHPPRSMQTEMSPENAKHFHEGGPGSAHRLS